MEESVMGGIAEDVGGLLPRPELAHRLDLEVYEDTREVFVFGEIGESDGPWFRKVMRWLEARSSAPVVVWINTPGGCCISMLAIYDAIISSPCEVMTIGTGEVCSAGVLLLASGSPGRRLATENCVLMSHENSLSGEESVRYSEAKDRRKFEDWLHVRWFDLMARHTAPARPEKDAAFWKSITNRRAAYWLMGAEALIAEGIVDAVYSPDLLPDRARRYTRTS